MNQGNWICCQIGAREHYSIPVALDRQKKLKYLITDSWIEPNSIIDKLPKILLPKLRERYHSQIKSDRVNSFTSQAIAWEIEQKLFKVKGWDKIIARNHWWQQKVIAEIEKLNIGDRNIILFAYSYAALEIFRYAKQRGWQTVLGQIDPGIIEHQLVTEEAKKHPQYQSQSTTIPQQYWLDWQKECYLSDKIIVNSQWSKQALEQTGIDRQKIQIIPLAYNSLSQAKIFTRSYPQQFSQQRPLKILFLGQVILRKGIAAVFEAIALLKNRPIEFWFVGNINIKIPKNFQNHPQIKWIGAVSRSQTNCYYQQADLFLFPTLSDGFGLTQLEAQAWKLPLITSQFCGAVVKDRINGLILPNVTGQAIADTINYCLENSQELTKFSLNSQDTIRNFSLDKLERNLSTIAPIKY